ncbi:unnamed protein product [Porites lobata]|uniref:Uncharacterized protein n=1 Tax=Porites lobata TaxID=104759 RepID=A0ABN8N5V4_9CNID|nr:unnamed protein product [Porites lobata]
MKDSIRTVQTCENCLKVQRSVKHIVSNETSYFVMAVATDCEECNKKALVCLSDIADNKELPSELELVVSLPDVVHVGKSCKCSWSNWFINLDGELSNLVLLRSFRDNAEDFIRKKLRKLLSLDSISFVDFDGKVRICTKSLKRRADFLSHLKALSLSTEGTVPVLRQRLNDHLSSISKSIDSAEHVQIHPNCQTRPSAICAANNDLLFCSDDENSCSFKQIKGICSVDKILFVTGVSAGKVKIVTRLGETISFLEILGSLYDTFGIHSKGMKPEEVSLKQVQQNVTKIDNYARVTVSKVKERYQLSETSATNSPQGTVSQKTQMSVSLLKKGMDRLYTDVMDVNPEFAATYCWKRC